MSQLSARAAREAIAEGSSWIAKFDRPRLCEVSHRGQSEVQFRVDCEEEVGNQGGLLCQGVIRELGDRSDWRFDSPRERC
jgi:hypothetical protein